MVEVLGLLALFALPMYVANASAMLLKGNTPLDLNIILGDKQRLLGAGKTLRGTLGGVIAAILFGAIAQSLFPLQTQLFTIDYLLFSTMAGIGAILGDIVASFFKRRLQFKPGHELILLDQLDFLIGGVVLTSLWYVPSLIEFLALVGLTIFLHRASNFVAYKVKLKKVPW